MSTLSDVAADALPVSAPLLAKIDLPAMPDDRIVSFIEAMSDEADVIGDYRAAALRELERRIRDRRATNPQARAIPHPAYEIELVDEYTPYRAHVGTLVAAQTLLPEDEAAKIVSPVRGKIVVTLPIESDVGEATALAKRFGGHVEVTPAGFVAGNVASIIALAKKYAGTAVGALLTQAISRDHTGEKLIFRRRKAAMKAVQS